MSNRKSGGFVEFVETQQQQTSQNEGYTITSTSIHIIQHIQHTWYLQHIHIRVPQYMVKYRLRKRLSEAYDSWPVTQPRGSKLSYVCMCLEFGTSALLRLYKRQAQSVVVFVTDSSTGGQQEKIYHFSWSSRAWLSNCLLYVFTYVRVLLVL